ncbi:hypothetical protein [Massilia aquatica]|uniref:Uncharacterized protein n=1 Tax=Massilia aquatica TaxID=2609000 RepID=A0ABX0M3J0_9BURK|nr:hypothetical protein [Massilia aquatica]NHZ39640.1 hypothetical protein [Massilia aquatica]
MATSGQQTRGITNLQRMVGKVRDVHRGGFPGSLALNPTYWKERLDPLHRPTTQLNPLWYVFLRDPNRGPDFFAWLARREAGEVRGVRYLELEDRATYRITFSNADGGVRVNFHPSLLGLSQDEKEVIFVLDRAGNFYVG